jgi:hypothetical protein
MRLVQQVVKSAKVTYSEIMWDMDPINDITFRNIISSTFRMAGRENARGLRKCKVQ